MADEFDDEFDEELLALAGDASESPEKSKRKRAASSSKGSSKRRKQDQSSDDEEPESEEDESNPYPVEGKYIDEADRQRLLLLPEIEREEIISSRLEERQRLQDKLNLDRMYRAQKRRANGSHSDEDASKSTKRKHSAPGQTKEKAKTLDALKEARRTKKERQEKKADNDGSASPVRRAETPDTSSDEEDGEINKTAERYDREVREKERESAGSELASFEDLRRARITRDMLSQYCLTSWFEDFVKGGWVRYMIGNNSKTQKPTYRLCEIIEVSPNQVPVYKVDDKSSSNQQLVLRHGAAVKAFNMAHVSNSPFEQDEWNMLVKTLEHDKMKLPRKSTLERKRAEIVKAGDRKWTEAETNHVLARRAALNSNRPSYSTLLAKKASLSQARTLAVKRRATDEIAKIDLEFEELEKLYPGLVKGDEAKKRSGSDDGAGARKIATKEEIEKEKRRRAAIEQAGRALLASVGGKSSGDSGVGTREGTPKTDLSARVRTFPKMRHEGHNSRSGTPGTSTPTSSTTTTGTVIPTTATTSPAIPALGSVDLIASSIEIDLGDF